MFTPIALGASYWTYGPRSRHGKGCTNKCATRTLVALARRRCCSPIRVTRAADTRPTPVTSGDQLTNLRRDLHREVHAPYHRGAKAATVTVPPRLSFPSRPARTARHDRRPRKRTFKPSPRRVPAPCAACLRRSRSPLARGSRSCGGAAWIRALPGGQPRKTARPPRRSTRRARGGAWITSDTRPIGYATACTLAPRRSP